MLESEFWDFSTCSKVLILVWEKKEGGDKVIKFGYGKQIYCFKLKTLN